MHSDALVFNNTVMMEHLFWALKDDNPVHLATLAKTHTPYPETHNNMEYATHSSQNGERSSISQVSISHGHGVEANMDEVDGRIEM